MSRPSQREEILRVASRLFSKKGYHATTIRQIAEERGILSGSLYAHIKSKEDLLFEIVDEGANAFLAAMKLVVKSDMDPIAKLTAGLAAHIRVIADHMEAATVFFHEWEALSSERRALIQRKRDEYEGFWTEILQEGVDKGVYAAIDIKFVRLLILSVANWAYQWYQPVGTLTPEQIAERFVNVIVHGLQDEPKGAAEHEHKN